jgi:ATP-dependent Zn protease
VSYSEIGLSDCAGLAVTTKPQRGVFMQILISSFPILLLIGVWIYFIRRMNKKGSPQERTMELIAEQNEIVRQQGQAIERIADAIDKRDPG